LCSAQLIKDIKRTQSSVLTGPGEYGSGTYKERMQAILTPSEDAFLIPKTNYQEQNLFFLPKRSTL
jgi:hypothetical protein